MTPRAFEDLDYLSDEEIQEHLTGAENYVKKFKASLELAKLAKNEDEIEEYTELSSEADELVEQIKKVIEYRKEKVKS